MNGRVKYNYINCNQTEMDISSNNYFCICHSHNNYLRRMSIKMKQGCWKGSKTNDYCTLYGIYPNFTPSDSE